MSDISNVYKPEHEHDDIDLVALLQAVWIGKWLILVAALTFAIPAVLFAINLPDIYKSDALIAPAESEKGSGLASLAGQFGGLASLAGVNITGGSSNKSQLAIETMRSHQFISQFIQNHKILPDIMAAESWERETDKVVYDEDLYNYDDQIWVRKPKPHLKPKPSSQEGVKAFRKLLSISENTDTGMISVSIEHVSPSLAKQWVDWLIIDINEFMKVRDVTEAQERIDYLNQQLEKTTLTDVKGVLYKLVEEQLKIIMFANVRDEYVFKTIDPALIEEERFKPNRVLISVIGALLGLSIGLVMVLSKYFANKE